MALQLNSGGKVACYSLIWPVLLQFILHLSGKAQRLYKLLMATLSLSWPVHTCSLVLFKTPHLSEPCHLKAPRVLGPLLMTILAFKRVLRPVSSSPVLHHRLLADLKDFIQVLPSVRRNPELPFHAKLSSQHSPL